MAHIENTGYVFKEITLDQNFDELLFIGDPHVKSTPIGKRKPNYTAGVLDKLEQCRDMANSSNALAIILGDLFHVNDENNLVLLNKLFKLFKSFKHVPFSLEGNHDVEGISADEEDALLLFQTGGLLKVISEPTLLTLRVRSAPVKLAFIPYGWDIPNTVAKDGNDASFIIGVTHHDLAIGTSYPGALPLKEIKNVPLVVNGHMHDSKKPVDCGATTFINPGNIEPLSIDLINHVPRVWTWTPENERSLTAKDLTYDPDMFDLKGYHVKAADAQTAVADLTLKNASPESKVATVLEESLFAAELSQAEESAPTKSHDTNELIDSIEFVTDIAGTSKPTVDLLLSLVQKVLKTSDQAR